MYMLMQAETAGIVNDLQYLAITSAERNEPANETPQRSNLLGHDRNKQKDKI